MAKVPLTIKEIRTHPSFRQLVEKDSSLRFLLPALHRRVAFQEARAAVEKYYHKLRTQLPLDPHNVDESKLKPAARAVYSKMMLIQSKVCPLLYESEESERPANVEARNLGTHIEFQSFLARRPGLKPIYPMVQGKLYLPNLIRILSNHADLVQDYLLTKKTYTQVTSQSSGWVDMPRWEYEHTMRVFALNFEVIPFLQLLKEGNRTG
jgi:hypothetical protein